MTNEVSLEASQLSAGYRVGDVSPNPIWRPLGDEKSLPKKKIFAQYRHGYQIKGLDEHL